MTTKYAILNPLNGEYMLCDSRETAQASLADIALAFYLAHTHDQICSFVDIQDDGSQIWTTQSGEVISPNPVEIQELIKQMNSLPEIQ